MSIAGYPGEVAGKLTVLPAAITSDRGTELSFSPATEEGFSGGPVMADGRVIGMVFEHTRTFGQAIPAAIVNLYLRGRDVRWGIEATKSEGSKAGLACGPTPSEPPQGMVCKNAADGLQYIWIPPGKFMMGCSPGDAECDEDEKPAHEVMISKGFWLGQTEVTQAAYERVMKTNPSKFKQADRPVVMVTWSDAEAYCRAIGGRLPTEAEWEYAARAGTRDARYGAMDRIAWFSQNSRGETRPAGQKDANGWKLYDMLGNVSEWVADFYGPYASAIVVDPQGPATGEFCVRRGGSWADMPRKYFRTSARDWAKPSGQYEDIGFRCAGELR